MTDGGYFNRANGFGLVNGVGTLGASDAAYLYGDSGVGNFVGMQDFSVLSTATGVSHAINFDRVTGVAGDGGTDVADFPDTVGNDIFVAEKGNSFASLSTGRFNRALGFQSVNFRVTEGGVDEANIYDSDGDDAFSGLNDAASLIATDYVIFAQILGAGDRVRAIKTHVGGTDTIELNSVDYIFREIGDWIGP